jgi:hypothetical protein
MQRTKKEILMFVLEQRTVGGGKTTLSLWMNGGVMTTDDRAALIYFWKKVEILNRSMTESKGS